MAGKDKPQRQKPDEPLPGTDPPLYPLSAEPAEQAPPPRTGEGK